MKWALDCIEPIPVPDLSFETGLSHTFSRGRGKGNFGVLSFKELTVFWKFNGFQRFLVPPQRKKPTTGQKFGNPFFACWRRAKNFATIFSFSSEDTRPSPQKNLAITYGLTSEITKLTTLFRKNKNVNAQILPTVLALPPSFSFSKPHSQIEIDFLTWFFGQNIFWEVKKPMDHNQMMSHDGARKISKCENFPQSKQTLLLK